ncbi:hypothetical protein ACROYT_G014937 [Oculina patagonica]
MSDMANQFYNAWVAVMNEGPRPKKLLCTWLVDKVWKEELRRKVGDATVESEVYKLIRTCLEQMTGANFEDCLKRQKQKNTKFSFVFSERVGHREGTMGILLYYEHKHVCRSLSPCVQKGLSKGKDSNIPVMKSKQVQNESESNQQPCAQELPIDTGVSSCKQQSDSTLETSEEQRSSKQQESCTRLKNWAVECRVLLAQLRDLTCFCEKEEPLIVLRESLKNNLADL